MMTIVYVSNAGHTERYAEMLSRKTGLKSLNINDAVKILPKGSSILLMGWVMGDGIQGYKKLCKLFNIKGICAVGMSKYSSKPESLRKTNSLPDDMPLFVLPAGIDVNKLHGFYKLIIKMMQKSISKKNGEKPSPLRKRNCTTSCSTGGIRYLTSILTMWKNGSHNMIFLDSYLT